LNRRQFLSAALFSPALVRLQTVAGGTLIETIPFGVPGAPTTPLNRLLGAGLDARLFTDLSLVTNQQLVTPSNRFFVRTETPATLPDVGAWKIDCGGLVARPQALDVASLEKIGAISGRYLIECAGNADPDNYGLISVADWEGVPVAALLDRIGARPNARVLVSGYDIENTPQQTSRTSIPGASWVFAPDDLRQAMLATRMNGALLPREHGAPVRLIVPGWYGCACIKWVNRIELVRDDAMATTQMMEFAQRTHQPFDSPLDSSGSLRAGGPEARRYIPATIDTAAVPVRIERWEVSGKTEYRVVGIVWGGDKPTNALAIRFKRSEPWVPVENCPMPSSTLTWSLWTHTWRPTEPGRYEIVLKVTDPTIRTRRLDLFYYVRTITIDVV
jgi:DMSO/TMAO reductase YedYZ molybdopterin-dependent catalytic subunit